jgi:putative flippase GtrA
MISSGLALLPMVQLHIRADPLSKHGPVLRKQSSAALKKGIRYALAQTDGQAEMVVTADADGQHLPEDIIAVAAVAMEKQSTAIGVRNFDSSVPLRSRFGNLLTRQVFRLVSGHDIRDTQTGLRAIMRHDLYALVDIPYNRYEFELEMLSTLVKAGPVEQVPINTVYEPQNPTSHFNPVMDSIRIYWVLFRYFLTILLISASEAFFIFLLTKLGASILVTIVVARAISVILYFNIARTFVFRSNGDVWKQAVQLLLLVAVNLVFLYAFVSILEIGFDTPRVLAAILGNMAFFVINFIVQRNLIFAVATRADKKEESN